MMNDNAVTLGKLAIIFCIFFGLGTALAWQALEYPMTWDDLHLFRSFSVSEILTSFHGHWDPDNIETPGLRPLALLFNHVRYVIFGENVIAHRLFALCLYALFLTMFCRIAATFDFPWKLAVVAGALSLTAKFNLYHYIWLTDGFHLLQGCLVTGSAIVLIKFLQQPQYLKFVLSLLLAFCGMLTREDTVAVIPAIMICGYVYLKRQGPNARMHQMHAYSAILIGACAIFLAYRHFVLPEAQAPGSSLSGMLSHVIYTFGFMGLQSFDTFSLVLICGWFAALVALAIACVNYKSTVVSGTAVLWLVCALLACTPGLNVSRINLLLFPITFMAFFLCTILWMIAKISHFWKSAATGIALWVFVGSCYVSSVNMQAFHPCSAVTIRWNSDFIYGAFARQVIIPEARRDMITRQLAAVGIFSWDDVSQRFPGMIAKALQENRRCPEPAGGLFVPRLGLFDDNEFLKKCMDTCKDQFRNFNTNLK